MMHGSIYNVPVELDSTLDEKEVQFFRGYMKMHPTKWDKLVDAGLWKDWHDESPARILKGSARNA
jgi:hypothetical protein